MELKTPLYDVHVREKGKIVPFAGYLLPVQYEGVIAEHLAVRKQAGLFDVSHMGEITIKGPGALATLNHLLTNDFTRMSTGKVRYSVMCNENGGCVDDLLVYKFGEEDYFLVVNASNRHKDFEHMKKNILPDTEIEDISDTLAQVALQGPNSREIMKKVMKEEDIPEKYYTAKRNVDIGGMDCIISYTGYTGEAGYEIYTANENAEKMWDLLRENGKEFGLIPCGLGARDTLRLEASMPLYGHEMDEVISPLETGLDFGVKMDKEEFIGKQALLDRGEPKICRVGLTILDRGVLREHQDVYIGDEKIGHTTSGTFSPLLKTSIAMALIDRKYSALDTVVEVDVRGRRLKAKIVEMPFYTRNR
ncbi:MAG: glycine cleavage system aminomethyltransferase GcvT [Erysipelotrichaceae bacterium]|nr:glycine cleavage system aminomethyltransferase GcvT [Erysipelotrichaceae bacterium]MBQ1533891.1 glycine cleavage system aminomethyltransferase GcvT [Erysipelotrichaceae bacterium]MBQ1787617.1 glycine cleavage system aminomethyltransferase GcvT [Erysipelotrichaceae bacterium]MBQ5804652.1 glycine cleavage system aminomethyltransferase GcvT [Erysipelotrichaceae bacterium]